MPLLSTPENELPPFRCEPLSPFRARVIRSLDRMPKGRAFCVVTTCDITTFVDFENSCRQVRHRPPSFYAYAARCMGETLQDKTHLLATRYGKQLIIPSSVQMRIAVEGTGYNDEKTPVLLMFKDMGTRDLPDISTEMTARLRELKRNRIPPDLVRRRFVPENSPQWWRDFVEYLRENRPHQRYLRACNRACVQLSSTSHWTKGHPGWGIPMFTPCALTVMLGGITQRPVVLDGEVTPRWCIDISITFDHDITDGAPATRYVHELSEEIESGRLLREWQQFATPQLRTQDDSPASTRTEPTSSSHDDFLLAPEVEESDDAGALNRTRQ